jgi:hypothetical protein
MCSLSLHRIRFHKSTSSNNTAHAKYKNMFTHSLQIIFVVHGVTRDTRVVYWKANLRTKGLDWTLGTETSYHDMCSWYSSVSPCKCWRNSMVQGHPWKLDNSSSDQKFFLSWNAKGSYDTNTELHTETAESLTCWHAIRYILMLCPVYANILLRVTD